MEFEIEIRRRAFVLLITHNSRIMCVFGKRPSITEDLSVYAYLESGNDWDEDDHWTMTTTSTAWWRQHVNVNKRTTLTKFSSRIRRHYSCIPRPGSWLLEYLQLSTDHDHRDYTFDFLCSSFQFDCTELSVKQRVDVRLVTVNCKLLELAHCMQPLTACHLQQPCDWSHWFAAAAAAAMT